MRRKKQLIPYVAYDDYNRARVTSAEPEAKDIGFTVYKISERPRPSKKDVLILCSFGEFGCEIISAMYCVPRFKQDNPDKYIIVVGWYGREYLYRHLVDEFWEINKDFMWLRDYALAFHHKSDNLNRLELSLQEHGTVVASGQVGYPAFTNRCDKCRQHWVHQAPQEQCPFCDSTELTPSLFAHIAYWRERAVRIPKPSAEKLSIADKFLRPYSVGITARQRKTYGRNLTPEFYEQLIYFLERLGYNPIWLGELNTTLPCPVPRICDASRRPETRDLELTLAITSKCVFTIQFYTASSRLAAMAGVPFILFESPDQIFGAGQEGLRLALTALGGRKLCLSHYNRVLDSPEATLNLVDKCITDMSEGNWDPVVGLVEDEKAVKFNMDKYAWRGLM